MTTIAANRSLMASDSRVKLEDGTIYPALKIFRVKDMVVGAAGDGENSTHLIEWAKNGFKGASRPKFREKDKNNEDDDPSAVLLILRSSGLHILTNSDSEPERIEADCFAIGTGGDAARIAMRFGASPQDAVEAVFDTDSESGPPVQVIHLKEET